MLPCFMSHAAVTTRDDSDSCDAGKCGQVGSRRRVTGLGSVTALLLKDDAATSVTIEPLTLMPSWHNDDMSTRQGFASRICQLTYYGCLRFKEQP